MKHFPITKPTTKQTKISRLVFMLLTVLLVIFLCYNLFYQMQRDHNHVTFLEDRLNNPDYEFRPGDSYEGNTLEHKQVLRRLIFTTIEWVWFAVSGIAILILCLFCSRTTCWIAWSLSGMNAIVWSLIDTQLYEYVLLNYHLFPFFSMDTNMQLQRFFKPTMIILVIAAATYFLIARLIEHKKESAQPTE